MKNVIGVFEYLYSDFIVKHSKYNIPDHDCWMRYYSIKDNEFKKFLLRKENDYSRFIFIENNGNVSIEKGKENMLKLYIEFLNLKGEGIRIKYTHSKKLTHSNIISNSKKNNNLPLILILISSIFLFNYYRK